MDYAMVQSSSVFSKRVRLLFIVQLLFAAGCLGPGYRKNGPIEAYDPQSGYRLPLLGFRAGNTNDVFVCLTFSGGGTRAAALAYGVLQGLAEIQLPAHSDDNPPHHLIDEVDVVSAVSGGSFTAAAFALERERLFRSDFRRAFLENNIPKRLIHLLTSPWELFNLPSIFLDRIDVAALYYDSDIFHNATYANIVRDATRPFIVVNATDLTREQTFEFTQDSFDLLGSDLGTVTVGQAVAASSAFPILLSPFRLEYYAGKPIDDAVHAATTTCRDEQSTCDCRLQQNRSRRCEWAYDLLASAPTTAAQTAAFDARKHKFMYLVDGGLSDNLGLSYVIRELRHGYIRTLMDENAIKKLVVIVVDAGVRPPEDLEEKPSAPGIFRVGYKTAITSMRNHSRALVDTIRQLMATPENNCQAPAADTRNADTQASKASTKPDSKTALTLKRYLAVLNFDCIEDPVRRKHFKSMRTNLYLPKRQVNELINLGGVLVKSHPQIARLLRDLRDDTAP